jgi:Protein of unknown function (DUF2934)
MSRSKSIPGSKTNRSRANNNKEQAGAVEPAGIPEINVAEMAAEAAPEVKASGNANPAAEPAASVPVSETKVSSPSKTNADGRKFEVMKTDSRKNLVPINLEDEIRRRAYELYEQRGGASGSEAEDWFAAEREVRQRYRQQSA